MSYEPTNWKSGDTVTSAKLNKMEQGIANAGALVCTMDENNTLDHTWQEIHDAAPLVYVFYNAYAWLLSCSQFDDKYEAIFCSESSGSLITITFVATSADGYPVME